MKKTLLFLTLIISGCLTAQDFTLLGNDAEGDPSIDGISDLKALYYSIDESLDSLWFKVEFQTALPSDLGIVFGIDTDLVLDNGLFWDSSNNTELLPEVVFTVNRNLIFPDLLFGSSNNDLNYNYRFGDDEFSIIINIELSDLDSDGEFNLVMGSSSFDCGVTNRTIFDDLPEDGYFSIGSSSGVEERKSQTEFDFFPNPIVNQLNLIFETSESIKSIRIIDSLGQLIDEFASSINASMTIDCSSWNRGVYFLEVEDSFGSTTKKLIKL